MNFQKKVQVAIAVLLFPCFSYFLPYLLLPTVTKDTFFRYLILMSALSAYLYWRKAYFKTVLGGVAVYPALNFLVYYGFFLDSELARWQCVLLTAFLPGALMAYVFSLVLRKPKISTALPKVKAYG